MPARSRHRLVAALSLGLLCGACAAPLTAATVPFGGAPVPAEPESGLLAVATSDGVTLRGVLVDGGDGEPLVLHLLPRGMSLRDGLAWAFGAQRADHTFGLLRQRGLSSVALDYRGVGWSPGDPDGRTLREDGDAIWAEALRRADGDPGRIVIRAVSLGTLITADLLARGAQPRAVELWAPVRARTVVGHAARRAYGPVLGPLVDGLASSPFEHDLADLLPTVDVPTLVVLPAEDDLLPPDERDLIAAAAAQGGARVVRRPETHNALVLRAYGFETDAEAFSGRLMDDLPEEERAFLDTVLGAD